MPKSTKKKIEGKDFLKDLLNSSGTAMQVIATGEKLQGSRKVKTFFAVVSGELLSSLYGHLAKAVDDINSSSGDKPLDALWPSAPEPKTQP